MDSGICGNGASPQRYYLQRLALAETGWDRAKGQVEALLAAQLRPPRNPEGQEAPSGARMLYGVSP
jgi:hypothetical protein